jgi:acetyl esterase/lipase
MLDDWDGVCSLLASQSGVPVEYRMVESTIHGFVTLYQMIDSGRQVLTQIAQTLRQHVTFASPRLTDQT